MAQAGAPIVIRRIRKRRAGGHHGGAWKVAFADFATAMMAFFLLMWLVAATTKEQRGGIAEYFNNPSLAKGKSSAPTVGPNGPGGASTSMIKLGGMKDLTKDHDRSPVVAKNIDEIKQLAKEQEKKRMEQLMKELNAAIEASQSLAPFKDQLLLDITPAGLRIQIVDKQNRPMFDVGSVSLKPYTVEILHELSKFIASVPNRISISGHTDTTPYAGANGYTNWELSADRANAARRSLVAGGLDDAKVAIVVGLSSSVPFDKTDPQAPINRRISIVVMNPEAEAAATGQPVKDTAGLGMTGPAAAADAGAGAAGTAALVAAPAPSPVPSPGTAPASVPSAPAAAAPNAAPAPAAEPGHAAAAPAAGTVSGGAPVAVASAVSPVTRQNPVTHPNPEPGAPAVTAPALPAAPASAAEPRHTAPASAAEIRKAIADGLKHPASAAH